MKKAIKRKDQKLIYIKWLDAHSSGGWHTPESLQDFLDKEECVVENVGWVFYEDKKEICMCARRIAWDRDTTPKESEFGMLQKIPKSWIIDRKILMEPK